MTFEIAAETLYTMQLQGGSLGLLDKLNRRVAMLMASHKMTRDQVLAKLQPIVDGMGW